MLNKFFLDKDYTVQLLMNMQVPVSMNDQLWDNSILLEIDADDTLNQYFVVDNGIDTEVLNVTPGQVNVLQVTEVWWAYGGVTTITPYKNGQAISDKIIDITFPEVVDNAGMISSTEEDPEEMVLVGQHYEMSGSEYPEQAVQEIQQEVQDIQENKQDKLVAGSGISIDPTTNTISATGGGGGGGINYSTTEQDTGLIYNDNSRYHVMQKTYIVPITTAGQQMIQLESGIDGPILECNGELLFYISGTKIGLMLPLYDLVYYTKTWKAFVTHYSDIAYLQVNMPSELGSFYYSPSFVITLRYVKIVQ